MEHRGLEVNYVMAGLSRKASTGVFEVSNQLALHLLDEAYRINVFGLADEHTAGDNRFWSPIQPNCFSPAAPKRLGYSKQYLKRLLSTPADVAHLQVIWMYQSVMVYQWHKKFGRPFITSVNGMLDPWAVKNSHLKKRLAYYFYERSVMNACSCFQVNTQQEYEYVRAFGLKNPVAIIKNGIAIPDLQQAFKAPPWKGQILEGKKVLLYLSRVHPKKGLVNLIKALSLLKGAKFPQLQDWMLVIVGCKEGGEHERELQELVAKKGLEENVVFLGQYYNENMQACYYHSDAYILPSYSDGMPLAALNAWAFGKYSLLTPACNLSEGYGAGIARKIEPNPDSIAEGLRSLFAKSSPELQQLGMQARAFVENEYSWKEMARKFSALYKWVCGQGPLPSFVRLS